LKGAPAPLFASKIPKKPALTHDRADPEKRVHVIAP
jgi:hypothetical protein